MGARDEVFVATFTGPAVGQDCNLVEAIFAAPLDAHREDGERLGVCKDRLAAVTVEESVDVSRSMEDGRVSDRCMGSKVLHTNVLDVTMLALGKCIVAIFSGG